MFGGDAAGGGMGPFGAAGAPSPEEILKMIQTYEAAGGSFDDPDVPQDLRDMVKKIKAAPGGQPGQQDADGVDVVPEPSFVVKTVDETGRKVFINVCGSEHVPAAGNWKGGVPKEVEEALAQQSDDDAAAEVLRFPISMGPLRRDLDKRGDPCFVTDCVFNLEIAREAARNRRLKQFVVELVLGWAGSKHKLQLDPKFKLPKIQYKGARVEAQRMRVDKKPVVLEVQDVPDEPEFPLLVEPRKPGAPMPQRPAASRAAGSGTQATAVAGLKGGVTAQEQSGAASAASITSNGDAREGPAGAEVSFEGRPVEAMVVRVGLQCRAGEEERVAGAAEVLVSGERLTVTLPGQPRVVLQLPLAADGKGATAVVEMGGESTSGKSESNLKDAAKTKGKGAPGWFLTVRLPVLPVSEWVSQIRAEAPLRLGAIPLATAGLLGDDEP